MEELSSNKRVRDELAESELESPEAKRLRDDFLRFIDDSDPDLVSQELSSKKRVRDELDSPEVKRLRDDLMCFIDDSDPYLVSQDLDSVMKSFELEISASSSPPVPVVNLTSDSVELQPDLDYLLEASDDELGLPPPTATAAAGEEVKNKDEGAELVRVELDSSGIQELWGLEDRIVDYDPLEFGVAENSNGENVVFDNLFEYSDACFESSDYSSFLWRPETLSAD